MVRPTFKLRRPKLTSSPKFPLFFVDAHTTFTIRVTHRHTIPEGRPHLTTVPPISGSGESHKKGVVPHPEHPALCS
jgi:hypothetical protein